MKKITLLFAFALVTTLSANAQVVRASLLTGIGVGGKSNGTTGSGNFTWHLFDLSYAPSPKFDAGVYLDMGVGGSSNEESADVKAGLSYGLQGKYYFLTNAFKPFIGVQAGLNSGASGTVDANGNVSNESEIGTKFQVTPQAGFRVGPLNLWAAYRTGLGFSVNGGLVWGFGNFK